MKKLILLGLLLFSVSAFAGGFKTENETRKYSDILMKQFLKEKFKEGFNDAKKYWPIPPVEIDGLVNQIKQQWSIVNQRFGKPIEIEFIKKEGIGKSFLRYFYLHKFQNHAIYWRIDFYKPNREWKINTIVFLDSLDVLYE